MDCNCRKTNNYTAIKLRDTFRLLMGTAHLCLLLFFCMSRKHLKKKNLKCGLPNHNVRGSCFTLRKKCCQNKLTSCDPLTQTPHHCGFFWSPIRLPRVLGVTLKPIPYVETAKKCSNCSRKKCRIAVIIGSNCLRAFGVCTVIVNVDI